MFYNMGRKLKFIGKIQFWALSVLSLLFAVAVILTNTLPVEDVLEIVPMFFLQWPNKLCESAGDAYLYAAIVFACGVVISYLLAVPTIAFGEMVEDIAENKRYIRSLSDHLRSKTKTNEPINTAAKQPANPYQQPYPVSAHQTHQVTPEAVVEPVAESVVETVPAVEPAAEETVPAAQ